MFFLRLKLFRCNISKASKLSVFSKSIRRHPCPRCTIIHPHRHFNCSNSCTTWRHRCRPRCERLSAYQSAATAIRYRIFCLANYALAEWEETLQVCRVTVYFFSSQHLNFHPPPPPSAFMTVSTAGPGSPLDATATGIFSSTLPHPQMGKVIYFLILAVSIFDLFDGLV